MRFRCLWAIYFIWLTIPAIRDQKKLVACYCIDCLRKANLVVVLAAGAVAPLLSLTIAGIPAAEPLERWASLIARYAVSGVLCR
jgi:hypothetical protein